MKKTRSFLIIPLVVMLLFSISSCNSKITGHQIVGKWEHDGHIFEFGSDGYVKNENNKYPFSVTNEKITIDKNGEALVLDYTINTNGTLTMNGLIYYPLKK